MTLGDKQRLFARHAGQLLLEAPLRGYAWTLGAAYRDPAWGVGHPRSLHGSRLAIDLNLFRPIRGELGERDSWLYLTDTADYADLGAWWKRQHKLARWGGDFDDGNHFSFEHEGMK